VRIVKKEVEREKSTMEKQEWSMPIITNISINSTESGAAESDMETAFEFPIS
jgi:hypothetical protein